MSYVKILRRCVAISRIAIVGVCARARVQIQNALARAVTRTHKYSHITSALISLHWFKIEQRIHYKIISFILLNRNIFINSSMSNHLTKLAHPSTLCLLLPPLTSNLKFFNRSFRISTPHLWNSLPQNLCTRQRRSHCKYHKYHPFVSFIYLKTSIHIPIP